jgi:hypothetical protein
MWLDAQVTCCLHRAPAHSRLSSKRDAMQCYVTTTVDKHAVLKVDVLTPD